MSFFSRLRKDYCDTVEIHWPPCLGHRKHTAQDAQQGRSERRDDRRTLGYVELLSEARTSLTDFFSILLEVHPKLKLHADLEPLTMTNDETF